MRLWTALPALMKSKTAVSVARRNVALEVLAWAGRHIDAIFIVGVAVVGLRFVAACIEAVSRGVERYRVLKANASLSGRRRE